MTDLGESKAVPERERTVYECLKGGGFTTPSPTYVMRILRELGTAEAKNGGYYRMLYDDLGCRESCMGWVNERAESAEAKVRELQAEIADDDTAVRTVANECRKDDEREISQLKATIREQAQTIERLTKALEKIASFEGRTLISLALDKYDRAAYSHGSRGAFDQCAEIADAALGPKEVKL